MLLRRAAQAAIAGAAAFMGVYSYKAEQRKQFEVDDPTAEEYDVVIVGGGIIGMATAREILMRFPKKTVCVLEKEAEVAAHQTGHNSGVIHAGMYYKPGTNMAKCCVTGAERMYAYCEKNKLPYERCGKLIVASTEEEHAQVEKLYDYGTKNGVKDLEIVYSDRIKQLEPMVKGYSALYSPNTGIVDYAAVTRSFASDVIDSRRGDIRLRYQAERFDVREQPDGTRAVLVKGREPGQNGPVYTVKGKNVISCAGLQADYVAEKAGGGKNPRVVPFRGTYWQVKPEYRDLVKMNIYPVPSGGGIPVGVHFTPTVSERRGETIIIGPGACVAFAREGYTFFDFSLSDTWRMISHVGMWRFVMANLSLSLGEIHRDLSRAAFMDQARRLIPSITDDMVEPSFAGVMVQVFNDDGTAASDYLIERGCLDGTTLHVRSAPSPACTSSMAIAEYVVDLAAEDFKWDGQVKPKRP